MAGHTIARAALLAAVLASGAVQAAETPTIHLSPSQWKSNGNGDYVCQGASCGIGSLIGYDALGALPEIDGTAMGPNVSAKGTINLLFRYVEHDYGFGPFALASAWTRRVRDYVEITGVGTVALQGKTHGIALALMIGPGDDVVIVSESGNAASAAHNLATALRSAGY